MTEPRAGLKRGYYLLNTDGATPGTHWAVRRLVRSCERPVWSPWRRSRRRSVLPPTTWRSTELIEGLKLARDYGIQRIRVYMDSELVVDQVNGVSAVRQTHLSELHEAASSLVALFKSIRISWVPRAMNAEADRLVRDALGAPD